jgi:hypothetical protein
MRSSKAATAAEALDGRRAGKGSRSAINGASISLGRAALREDAASGGT